MPVEWSHLNTLKDGLTAVSYRMNQRLDRGTVWSTVEVEEMLDAEVRKELSERAEAMSNQALSEQIYKTMNMQLPLPPANEVQPSKAWPRASKIWLKVDEIDESRWVLLLVLVAFAFGVLMGNI